MSTYNVYENSTKINLLGRAVLDDKILKCAQVMSGFEFSGFFGGDITVNLKFFGDDNGYIGAVVDNDYENMLVAELSNRDSFATFTVETFSNHNIKILKLNEHNLNKLYFYSVDFDGDLGDRPQLPNLKLEFYGDSITCGYGNLSVDRSSPIPGGIYQNGAKTYAALLARRLGASIGVAAASGHGIFISNDGSTERTFKAFWDYAVPDENIKWNFNNYKADIVFINLGTNDICYSGNTKKTFTHDELYPELKFLIDGIRRHNPDCKIVAALGAMGRLKNEYTDVESVYEQLAGEYDRLTVIDGLQTKQRGGDYHPNLEDHIELENMLYNKLVEKGIV